jgi:hypothetical protein
MVALQHDRRSSGHHFGDLRQRESDEAESDGHREDADDDDRRDGPPDDPLEEQAVVRAIALSSAMLRGCPDRLIDRSMCP